MFWKSVFLSLSFIILMASGGEGAREERGSDGVEGALGVDSTEILLVNVRKLVDAGTAFMEGGQADSARMVFNRSLNMSREEGFIEGEIYATIGLASLENRGGNHGAALTLANEAENLLESRDRPYETMKIYSILSIAYEGMGQLDKALDYRKRHFTLSDSLNSAEIKGQILEFKEKYESAKKEGRIAELNHERIRQRLQIRLLVGTGIASTLIFIAVFLLFYFRHRLTKQKLLTAQLERDETTRDLTRSKELLQEHTASISSLTCLVNDLLEHFNTLRRNSAPSSEASLNAIAELLDNAGKEFNWHEFEPHFTRLHPEFISRLKARGESLTPTELQLAVFLKAGLTSKDISFLLNKSVRTIEDHRYSLRRKLSLENTDNLAAYLKDL